MNKRGDETPTAIARSAHFSESSDRPAWNKASISLLNMASRVTVSSRGFHSKACSYASAASS